ncbi:hypothetical protein JHN61_33330 [Streptomyces sp. MBT67]|uniref:hypothetical protein n=1 Tax=unclassified Streptomyces TaxID=2593676 RepID=UPI00190B526C|nr:MULTISPECIES: hypothetical protein [unclassified Streptomyces]MBK3534266.1 hypothetical protein [Streptomyces sp. MBT72]MBK3540996.1 hypothetical protein [Streptomyces sp. MBT67]MBK3554421.1 hypothetical protein [Streptomyces sp. MBT61]MBK6033058.1 hypothetical protein [Streptomyces sp. MBT59]
MTVLCEGDELRRLERWAALRPDVKFTHIALARGRTASQPMLTLRGSRPSYEDELAAVREAGAALAGDGFAVARVKVECAPWAAEVPREDADVVGSEHPHGRRHFEHHVKLLLDEAGGADGDAADGRRADLVAVAVRHGAHVSWNARRVRADGREERFVTQRCHRTGDRRAALALDALLAELAACGYEVVDVEREYVLLDSGPELDEGWLEAT